MYRRKTNSRDSNLFLDGELEEGDIKDQSAEDEASKDDDLADVGFGAATEDEEEF
ncbi:MAG: hypothetical protein UY19_C0022G0006 [Candidatus Wolfebacteria bacterium GW2011_GWA2_47_9b]|uniref:Uncharacterized protein n=1 Tax=Candidatus Wolfebacteria bacterium GW2011_GWA2_47_9b TaxID=1619005 RepID=A0A0G1U4E7_9BACT|nr:MAG: hypothetical protein UY19_C0022G0006 [Candidatus Wolfebacteria bacterium GW2011_GWA2_47_9b]